MKTIKQTFLAAFFGVLLVSNSSSAQEDKQYLITATTLHWNMNNEDFSIDEWKAVEKEYLDKVVKKNPFIIGQEFLMHYFTADNTELILVTTYESWDALKKRALKKTNTESFLKRKPITTLTIIQTKFTAPFREQKYRKRILINPCCITFERVLLRIQKTETRKSLQI